MKAWRPIFFAAVCWLAATAAAQDTNILRTEIGQFENRTGAVIVKGYSQIGSIEAGGAEISVRCKETTDVGAGRKLYGLAIQINLSGSQPERLYVDEDEIGALLAGVNYLAKISNDATAMQGFEASYTTKSGLQVLAHSIRKEGSVQFALQGNYSPPVPLSPVQMTQLYGLIGQARKNLDAVKGKK